MIQFSRLKIADIFYSRYGNQGLLFEFNSFICGYYMLKPNQKKRLKANSMNGKRLASRGSPQEACHNSFMWFMQHNLSDLFYSLQ